MTISKRLFHIIFILFPFLSSLISFAQNENRFQSPSGKIEFSLTIVSGKPQYSVWYDGKQVIADSNLSIVLKNNDTLTSQVELMKTNQKNFEENYNLIVGKSGEVSIHGKEAKFKFREKNNLHREFILEVRLFNDGVALRYLFPRQKNWDAYEMTDEISEFNIVGNPKVHTLFHSSYSNSHEGLYDILSYQQIKPDVLMDMPTLFQFSENLYLAITEASLRDYAGMYLKKDHNNKLVSQLSPLPGQKLLKVRAELPHQTPWRVLLIGNKIGTLLQSNVITSLNEPTKVKDKSWIKPGKTTFHWWNGDVIPDTTITPGINFETNKYYIDFCARNNIEYHSIIGYGGIPWYINDAVGYSTVGPNTDVTKPVPSLDMQKVCDYARKKGVGIHVWVNWKAIYPDLEKAFSQFEEWGVKGMMVDFLNRDDQEMVNIQEEILKKAAEHKLFIQFHGAYKPTGLNRTYPNEFTREGTYNYEMNKFVDPPITPEHDLNVVFTRLIAGATDYHLGGFRAVPREKYKPQFTRPLMIGTRCHMLAMYVVLESYLTSLCDYPEAYENEKGFEILKEIPTVWDETVVPVAEVDRYAVIARRKGEVWFVGGINNSTKRSIELPLSFLSKGSYIIESYQDSEDAEHNPNQLITKTETKTRQDLLNISMASGGGFILKIIRLDEDD